MTYPCISRFHVINASYRLDDEAALKAKVDEAVSVYEDYTKTATKDEEAPKADGAEEEKKETAEEAKPAEEAAPAAPATEETKA